MQESAESSKGGQNPRIAEQSDIIKLAAHIEASNNILLKILKEQKDSGTFNMLTHSLVTHILVRRRPVDFKLAKLRHYGNVDKNDELIQMTEKEFSREELDVCRQFHIFYVPGKNLDIVPIVLTKTMRKVLEVIIEHRQYVNVTKDTLFVLANEKPIQPTKSIKILKMQVKLKKPQHLTVMVFATKRQLLISSILPTPNTRIFLPVYLVTHFTSTKRIMNYQLGYCKN